MSLSSKPPDITPIDQKYPHLDSWLHNLLEYIRKKPGEKNGRTGTTLPPPDHPFRPLYEAVKIMRQDYNKTLREKTRAEKKLQKSYQEMDKYIQSRTAELSRAITELNREIIERHKAEMALKKSEEKFRSIFEESKDLFFISNPEGKLLELNPAGMKILGFDPDINLGTIDIKNLYVDPRDRETAKRELATKGFIKDFLYKLRRKDGKEITVIETTTAVKDQRGNVTSYRGVLRDVTEKQKKEEEIKMARVAAERANRAKSEFLANISHEIRTPLNAIMGFSELIMSGSSPEKNHDYAGLILSETEILLRLINELLDIAKADAGKFEIESLPFDLARLLESINSSFNIRAQRKGLGFKTTIARKTPRRLIGDPTRLRQILANLVGNAIKFTEKGSVLVKVKPLREKADRVTLYFEVKDTGIGIPQEKQAVIFDSFVQVDGSTTRKYGGTGLGTTICRKLTELMGGEIGLRSQVGKGSTFWFTLHFQKRYADTLDEHRDKETRNFLSAPPFNPELNDAPASGNILVVEDYPTNQEIIVSHLQNAGFHPDLAENGQQALDLVINKNYDLILMDLQMPVMDGYSATDRIRKGKSSNKNTPILAMTANVFKKDRMKCMKAGMNDVIAKPIRKKMFLNIVRNWLNSSAQGPKIKQNQNQEHDGDAPAEQNIRPAPLDYPLAIREFEGDQKLVDRVIRNFLKDVDSQLAHLKTALSNQDLESIRIQAHRIKGGASNITALPLAAVAGRLEKSAKSGKIKPSALLVDRLEMEFQRLKEFISLSK